MSVDSGVKIDCTATIADVIGYLATVKTPNTTRAYQTNHFPQVVKHLKRIAGRQIRAAGSLCGNLMIAYAHQDPINGFFCSDAATVMMGLGAVVTIVDPVAKSTTTLTMTLMVCTASTLLT